MVMVNSEATTINNGIKGIARRKSANLMSPVSIQPPKCAATEPTVVAMITVTMAATDPRKKAARAPYIN